MSRSDRRSKNIVGFFVLTLFVAVSGSMVFSQSVVRSGVDGLTGKISDSAGRPISGATVLATNGAGTLRETFVTGDDGAFSFRSARGTITFVVSATSFAETTRVIEQPYPENVTITLNPRPIAAEVSITSALIAVVPDGRDDIVGTVDRVDKETLENSHVFNFSEALRKVPGVNVRDEEGFGLRPNVGIRGTNPTRSTKVLFLEDGVPLAYAPYGDNASYYHPPVERYYEVEILKGSSQIVYGPQTIAGVINYLTPSPTEKPSFSIGLTGGNRSYFNGALTGSGTIRSTGIFAAFTRKQGDGSRENTDSRLNDLSVKAVHTINTRNAITAKFSRYGEDSTVTYSGLTTAEFAADPRQNPFRNDSFVGSRYGTSISHSAVLAPTVSLTTNFYYNFFSRDWWRQSSNSGQRPNRLNVDPDCLSMADLNTTCGNEGRLRDYNTAGLAPNLVYSYGGSRLRGELQAGFRMHWEKQDRRQLNGDLPNSRTGVAVEINQRRNFATSGYVQNRFVLGRFTLTPGIRFERINIERTNYLAVPAVRGETDISVVIPGVGVSYQIGQKASIYGGVHRGFSPPRAEDIITNSGLSVELDPEQSWNYELGFRANPLRGVRVDGAFFRLDYENQVVPASVAGGAGAALTNGGQTLQQGFEFSGKFDSGLAFGSAHNFFVRSAVTVLSDAEFRGVRFSSTTAAATLNVFCPPANRVSATQCSITGNRLPYVPRFLATTTVGYSHSRGFRASLENVYLSSQFGDDLNATSPTANGQIGSIPSQLYWNATTSYSVERWRTTLFVTAKNLTDRTSIIDRTRGILPSSPRSLQAGFKVRF